MQDVLQGLENKSLKLPMLPEVAVDIRDAVENMEASIGDITRIIASDAALSARLIEIANNRLIQTSKVIDSLDMAVELLGKERVRDLLCILVMEQLFHADSDFIDKKLRQIWEHSMTVAAISHVLAAQFTGLSPLHAMLAGLVHDIGSLPILTKAKDYPELLERDRELDMTISALHAKVGVAILEAWKFPAELLKVPAEHENLERDSAEVDYVDVVTVANLQSYLGSQHPLARMDWSTVPAFAKLGLNPEVNVIEMEETADDVKEAQRMLRA